MRVEAVDSKKALKAFIDFPHALYETDENYVPELFIAQRDLLTRGKHPFHEHSEMQLFLLYDNGVIKGRIAAILNNNHNAFNGSTDGFFGFFECVDDGEIAASLFSEADRWLRQKGATRIIGPVNPSTNEPCGLLVDGFSSPPVAMTPYNKPYYSKLVEQVGFGKKIDLLAYDIRTRSVDSRSVQLHDHLLDRLRRRNITIRPVNIRDFKNEVRRVREVYNAAWDKNAGFVPMTPAEFDYLAKDLKLILDPGLCLLAEQDGQLVGFSLAIPDINQVLRKIHKGRLLPFGIIKLLFGLKKVNYVRVLALGIKDDYRKMGIEACFYASTIKHCLKKNIEGGEASWILENNALMNKGILSMNGTEYKRHRIYEKSL